MAICGGCNAETRRITLVMTTNGGKDFVPDGERKEICPNCAPEQFQEPWAAPADRRVWQEHEALPHLYHRRPDGGLELNDSQKQDIQTVWDQDPDTEAREKAIAKKRTQRRTAPLTEIEIQQAQNLWTPIIKQRQEDIQRQIDGDQLYTESLVEKYVKQDHERQKIYNC